MPDPLTTASYTRQVAEFTVRWDDCTAEHRHGAVLPDAEGRDGRGAIPGTDADVAGYARSLGLPGLFDIHVHLMPDRVQEKVWRHFDSLDKHWPINYRLPAAERLTTLAYLGTVRHTALAYAHRPGMAAWLNDHTLGLAREHPAVVPSFTFYPEPGVDGYVAAALAAGGRCAKVHLQVGKFHVGDPRLDGVWTALAARRVPVVLHASAVDDGSEGREFCGPGPIAALLDRFPDLVLVIAHLGAPDYAGFLDLARAAPTLCLDTTMALTDPPFRAAFPPIPADRIEQLAEMGNRVLFGSDFPTIPHDYAAAVRGLTKLGFGDEWLRAVLWHNAARLVAGVAADAPTHRGTADPPVSTTD